MRIKNLTCTLYIILYSYTLYCPEANSTAIIYSANCLYPILWKFSFLRFEKTRRQKWRQLKSSLFSGHKILHWGRKLFGPDSVVRQDCVQGAWRYHYHYHYRGQNSLRLWYSYYVTNVTSIYVKISPECSQKWKSRYLCIYLFSYFWNDRNVIKYSCIIDNFVIYLYIYRCINIQTCVYTCMYTVHLKKIIYDM